MKPLDITLCLIVKNEEKYVATCIESVKPLVSKIRIGDTGSTDRTVSICKQYTDHIEDVDFSAGFSQARNHLLKQVDTEWVLFLDADEYFDRSALEQLATLLPSVSAHVDALSFLRYNFFSSGAFYTSETIKLFRAHPEIFYTGVVVDSVKPSLIKKGGGINQLPIILNHFGHCRSIQVRDRKAMQYLDMIDEELALNPCNFKAIGYKALILRTLGRLQEAEQWGKKAMETAPNQGHPHFVRGHIERAFGQHQEAAASYTRAIELEGVNALYLNSRGVANLTMNNLEGAEKDFSLGIDLFPHHIHFTINLGLVEQARGHYQKALEKFQEVGQKYPAFLKSSFEACSEIDPYSGYIYDTLFNFHGLSYHLSYCQAKVMGIL
jgi:glycosyltransferase involved in cell wall biosynthesis